MTSDEWKVLQEAFASAVELSGGERAAFIAGFESSHPALAQRLRDLLDADTRDDALLKSPIAATAESLAESEIDPWPGRRIGQWTIVERIASGGMGAVFLAERADGQYAQTAAIKLMATQLLATGAIGRFRAERQILANLDHPCIARLIDGGATDDGLPYLVMDYIDGLPIDKYCDANNLSIDERLVLFRKVCTAVDYAHRQLVVHRDLKPSNILVDRDGMPRLLDFGIAKLLEQGAGDHTVAVTRDGVRAMTPEYASPEQVRGEPVSVATDVYALGVLLYKLMTGAFPYGVSPATPREYEAAIIDSDPIRPSTIVASSRGGASTGRDSGMSVDDLRRRLAGDLDNIALMALQKEPERRYATANALAADIGRYLASKPVEARGDDWAYRARKFVVRNARGLGIAAAVFAAVVALTAWYTWQLANERDRANLAAAQATEVSSFLTSLFASASPHRSKGETITAIDLLQQGRERIEALEGQPALQAELMRIMAASMTALGELDQSTEMLERVLEMKRAEEPPDPISISLAAHDLAEAARQNRELDKAEFYERMTLAIAVAELGATNSDAAYVMSRLGVILFDARKAEQALALEQRALDIMLANGDGESSSAIDVRGNIANALSYLGRYEEAETLLRETLELSLRIDGRLAPNTVIRRTNLGLLLTRRGEYRAAVELFRESIDDGLRVWDADYSHIDFMKSSLGTALGKLGRVEASLATFDEALAIAERRDGRNSRAYMRHLRLLAEARRDMAHYDESGAAVEAALAIASTLDEATIPDIARLRILEGQLLLDRGQFVEAEAGLRAVLDNADGLSLKDALALRRDYASALAGLGRYDEAVPLLDAAIDDAERAMRASNPDYLGLLAAACAVHRAGADLPASQAYGERLASIIGREPPAWQHAMALGEYGRTLAALGDARSGPILTRARQVLVDTFGPADPRALAIEQALHTPPPRTDRP